MFFRRVFQRKDNNNSRAAAAGLNGNNINHQSRPSPKRTLQRRLSTVSDDKRGLAVIQLTPLWEHIIRTRTLPDDISPQEMFEEFRERLRDPEWQVRQHALRVLVDVLIVIGQKADTYFAPLLPQLVENLGHEAPTVRKGALDALRVYVKETAMPETIILEILDIGFNQRINNEPFGGRLTCGVMLSLPSLIQPLLHTGKQGYILKSTIDMLTTKMTQVTHQEVTLKVLIKIRELIGTREFLEYMSHGNYREFELLCNVYGLGELRRQLEESKKSWKVVNQSFEMEEDLPTVSAVGKDSSYLWTNSNDASESSFGSRTFIQPKADGEHKKKATGNTNSNRNVIMETEIKISDETAVTMRIMESSKDENSDSTPPEIMCSSQETTEGADELQKDQNNAVTTSIENSGLIQLFSDSEVEEINNNSNAQELYDGRRTPRRVTFGGEIVKLRTPDSDTTIQHSDTDDLNARIFKRSSSESNLKFLTIDIPYDNTKPILTSPSRIKSAPLINKFEKSSPVTSSEGNFSPRSPNFLTPPESNPFKPASASPKSRFSRINISPADNVAIPKGGHKEVEVLHNLQRSPCISPTRLKRQVSSKSDENSQYRDKGYGITQSLRHSVPQSSERQQAQLEKQNHPAITVNQNLHRHEEPPSNIPQTKSWEDLNLVGENTAKDLKSGDWRQRSHAICTLEEALRSTDNLALVQPHLDSLLRTLLSAEKNSDVSEDKRRVLMNLISRLPLDNLEDRTTQIITGLCRQGGAGSNRIVKSLMQRLPPAVIVLKLLSEELLHARSSKFRENALQMVMYALMTFPSTYFDTTTCVTRATHAALDRKKRVRQAALDVLAVLGQVTSPKTVLDVVQDIAMNRENGSDLLSAVKTRLSRKQLPILTPDGTIQYTLKIPSPHQGQSGDVHAYTNLGADIDWISSGIGSVSPTSVKRRSQQYSQQPPNNRKSLENSNWTNNVRQLRAPHEILALGVGGVKPYSISEEFSNAGNVVEGSAGVGGNYRSHLNTKILDLDKTQMGLQYSLATGLQTHQYSSIKQPQGGGLAFSMNKQYEQLTHTAIRKYPLYYMPPNQITGEFFGQRISSFSDSSQDSRSSGSNTGSSSGSRISRLPLTSRFPAVERLEATGVYMDRSNNNHETNQYQRLSSTYPKATYTTNGNSRRIFQTASHHSRDVFTENSFGEPSGPIYNYSQLVNEHSPPSVVQSHKRFSNVDRIVQSNKRDQSRIFNDTSTLNDNNLPQIENTLAVIETNFMHRGTPSNSDLDNFEKLERDSSQISGVLQKKSVEKNHSKPDSSNDQSSEERSSSGHSTPTKKIGADESPISNIKNIGESSFSTPQSIKSYTESNFAVSRPNSHISSRGSAKAQPENISRPQSVVSKQSEKIVETIANAEVVDKLERLVETKAIEIDAENFDGSTVSEESPVRKASEQAPDEVDFTSTATTQLERFESTETISAQLREIEDDMLAKPEKMLKPNDPEMSSLAEKRSITKSHDSIFNVSLNGDADSKSLASNETSSDYPPSHPASLDEKERISSDFTVTKFPITTLRKSKTTLFGRNTRKVSPVKQSMKLSKAEIYPSTLGKFDKPKEALTQFIDQIDSPNWETIVLGLCSLVRLMRHHPETVESNMHMTCIQLSKAVRNLRSQVSRAACQASKEFFQINIKHLEQECDDLTASLLHRTADTNRFLRSDAHNALESMCDHLTPYKVLCTLTTRGLTHQNAMVKTTTARLLTRLAERIGPDRIVAMNRENRDKFINAGATLLMEGSLETRNYAKAFFRLLADHPLYNRILLDIPPRTFRNIEKSLRSIV